MQIHKEEKRSNLATRISGRRARNDPLATQDPLVGNLTKNLNPHSMLVRPVKLHPKIPKDQLPIRIPDASQKDSKISQCATAGYFYKNGRLVDDSRTL